MVNEIGCCYFPTTVVLVDDQPELLSAISLKIGRDFICKTFDKPLEALKYLVSIYPTGNFLDRCLSRLENGLIGERRNIDAVISSIHEQLFNPRRFELVSVLIVDFAMPGLTGEELCRKLNGMYKIILLTGEADDKKAIKLFNQKIIHQFIHKNSVDYLDELRQAIAELQKEYFVDLSSMVLNNVIGKPELFGDPPSCLRDMTFVESFYRILKDHHITEYYLIDESGSFLLVDKKGHLSWLIVKDEDQMKATEFEVGLVSKRIPADLRQMIERREVIRHWFSEDSYPDVDDLEEFTKLFYPAVKLEGKSNYYLSYFNKPLLPHNINVAKIVSYDKYRHK